MRRLPIQAVRSILESKLRAQVAYAVGEQLEYVDRNGGSNPLTLVVTARDGSRLDTRNEYKDMWALQNALEDYKGVGTVISLPVLMADPRQGEFPGLRDGRSGAGAAPPAARRQGAGAGRPARPPAAGRRSPVLLGCIGSDGALGRLIRNRTIYLCVDFANQFC